MALSLESLISLCLCFALEGFLCCTREKNTLIKLFSVIVTSSKELWNSIHDYIRHLDSPVLKHISRPK